MTLPGLDVPLRTIFCIGRNYVLHAKELGNPVPAEPVVFLKPVGAVVLDGGVVPLPADSARVDHEVELVVGLGKGKVPVYAVGVDFTARDIQEKLKKEGLPWAPAKGRRGFAALGAFAPATLPQTLTLTVNGETRQSGNTADMLFDVPKLLAYLEATYGLGEGDVIYTGTPPGVGPLKKGDRIEASLGSVSRLTLTAG
jgi:2-keto-4-pentenoate hydratase/2-oxohepta-3-ene-1,7-dioic acid hydratase in catechol pathway